MSDPFIGPMAHALTLGGQTTARILLFQSMALTETSRAEHLRSVGSAPYEQGDGESALDLAHGMRLVAGPRGSLLSYNVGILMFSCERQRFFPCARVEVSTCLIQLVVA